MIDRYQQLENYVMESEGTSRTRLNVMLFIGLFVLGWALRIVFSQLGKEGKGWIYFIPYFILAVGMYPISVLLSSLSPAARFVPFSIALIIYVIGWVHANIILSRYEELAKSRILEIENQSSGNKSADLAIEKGLLEWKVLCSYESAVSTLSQALVLPGGDPHLFNFAGMILANKKRYELAKQFFEQALLLAPEESLIDKIKKQLSYIGKKLR